MYKTTDGGLTWLPAGLTFSLSQNRVIHKIVLDPTNPTIVFAATNVGIYRSTNSGTSFTSVSSINCWDIKFNPSNLTIVYATGSAFYRSNNSGASFTLVSTGIPTTGSNRMAIAVTPLNPSNVYVLASKSSDSQFMGVYQSTDDGQTFVTKSTSPNIIGNSCAGTSTGAGQGWYDLAIAASPINSGEIVVGGVNVFRSTNNGTSWTNIGCWNSPTPYIHADIHELQYAPNGTLFSSNDGGIFSYNGTSTWTDLTAQRNIAQIYKLGLSGLTVNKWITGHQDNGTNIRNGANYVASLSGDGMDCFIDRTNDAVMYGEQYNGSLNRSTNGGSTWGPITTGITGTGDWVTPWKQDPTVANTIYAGFNTMFKSTNQGSNWSQIGTTGGGSSIVEFAIAPSNTQIIYVLQGSIRKTINGGSSWTNVTNGLPAGNATFITINPTNPNMAWVTLSGYTAGSKVFQTVDGGATWMNITGNLPNLPANCSVYETGSNDRIYIGMDVGIYYKDNSSTTWTLYNAGLPNVAVMDMEMSPASPGKIYAATYGRGVYMADVVPTTAAPLSNFSYYGAMCAGTSKVLVDNSSNTPTSWSWTITPTTGVTFNSTSVQNPTLNFTSAGVYSISMISGNGIGTATAVVTKTLSVYITPTLVLSANSMTVCDADPFTVSATGATSYTWSYSGGYASTTTYTPMGDWTYTVTGSNSGCTAKDTVHVVNIAKPTLVLSANSLTVCEQTSFSVSVSGANTYTWSNGGGNSANVTFSTPTAGYTTYTVTGEAGGCLKSDTINVLAISCVGILELKQYGTSFKVYPNPTNDKLTLKMNDAKLLDATIELFDVSGKSVLKQHAKFDKDKTEITISIAALANGVYSLKLISKQGSSQTLKIVKE